MTAAVPDGGPGGRVSGGSTPGNADRSAMWQAAVALLYTGMVLTVIEYWLHPVRLEERLRDWPVGSSPPVSLKAGSLWSLATVLGYAVVPMLLVVFWHRESLTRIGCRLRGFGRHLLVYLALFACMVPVILFVARREDFLAAYPFVASATENRQDFFLWELAYVAQFFALEAFFRGYLLFTLEKACGWLAIFVMTVPYCMIHYHKPPLEAFGAIIAGVILGWLALRFRSWYGGAILHSLVAVTMDSLAASRAELF